MLVGSVPPVTATISSNGSATGSTTPGTATLPLSQKAAGHPPEVFQYMLDHSLKYVPSAVPLGAMRALCLRATACLADRLFREVQAQVDNRRETHGTSFQPTLGMLIAVIDVHAGTSS